MKTFLKITALVLLIFILVIALTPLLFKDKIVKLVKEEINHNITAKVDFSDARLSWFQNFPKLTLSLEDISVAGIDAFEGDTLLTAKSIAASVDILSVINGKDMKVHGIYLHSPRFQAKINKDGKANWEITKEDPVSVEDGKPSTFQLNLEQYEITDGFIIYSDETSGMRAEVTGFNHTGRGNFSQDLFTLSTQTKTTSANFTYAGIPYLVNAATGMDADIEVNNSTSKYSFKNASLMVNDLKVLANGFVQLLDDSTYNMDIRFDAPFNDFKNILSLVPAVYKTEFNKIKTSGQASFKGFAKGTYSSSTLPSFTIDLAIKDGMFQYPDLPKPVKNIQLAARFSNPDGVLDHTIIDIPKASMQLGENPVDFKLLFKSPETSRYIDLSIKGKMDLAEVTQLIKLEAGTQLSGMVHADVYAKGQLAAMESGKEPFSAGGFFTIRDLAYSSKDLPFPVKKGAFDVQVQNTGGIADATAINITTGHVELGEDILDFALKIDKPVSDIAFSGSAKGNFSLNKIEKFMTLEPGTTIRGLTKADIYFTGSKADMDKGAYEKILLNGNAAFSKVEYQSKEYPEGVNIQAAQLQFTPAHAVLHSLIGNFQGTRFTASGMLDNMVAYALDKGQLKGNIHLSADRIQLNKWLGSADTTTADATSTDPFPVPANMDITLHAQAGAVEYDKVEYKNVTGKLQVKDETVQLQQVQTEALDGTIGFNGSYSTRISKKQPDISLNYSIREIDIQKAFFAFNTLQKLMPVGQFLSGKMTSKFQMAGKLKGDMYPDLSSLSGNGDLLLVQGFLSKFQPLEKLAQTLQVADLKEISLKDIKTHFAFTNGKVLVQPFSFKVKDMDLQIGGTHSLDQSMEYLIGLKIPRSYMGTAGNNLVSSLTTEANRKGIPVSVSDIVSMNIRMTGSMSHPVVKADLKEAASDMTKELKQQAISFVQQKTDNSRKAISDSLYQMKKQVVNEVKTNIVNQITGTWDSAGKNNFLDSTKKKAGEKLKGTFKDLLNKKKTGA